MEQTVETKYRDAFLRERPVHTGRDEFSVRHPRMSLSRRAKIFSPFSALKGFEEAIDSKLEIYVSRRELGEEDQERLNRCLLELTSLTGNGRRLRENPVVATVCFYVPCDDENHEAYGLRGQYRTLSGMVQRVDPIIRKSIRIDGTEIEFADIAEIRIENQAREDD